MISPGLMSMGSLSSHERSAQLAGSPDRVGDEEVEAEEGREALGIGKAALEDVGYSDPVELFRLDFQNWQGVDRRERIIDIPIRRDGLVDGFLHWIWLHFSDDLVIENHPETFSGTWSPQFHLFHEPFRVHRGQTLRIQVSFDDEQIYIEPLIGDL